MDIDAIIFDKDGTLIDFDAFWVKVSFSAIKDVLKRIGHEEVPVCEILKAFGVHNGITDINGVLCKGTYKQMGQVVYDIVYRYGCNNSCDELERMLIEAYNKNASEGEIKPTSVNLRESLIELKKRNSKLAVVTTDNKEITHICLDKLGIKDLFDRIYTDDSIIPTKPDTYCVYDFCKTAEINRGRVVVAGDTLTDIDFARNAGVPVIGIAKTEKNKQILETQADVIITDVAQILDLLS